MLTIVADENLPFVADAFSEFGTVQALPARQITNRALQYADVLLVRAVTPVNRDLLAGAPVRFVGTATIGTDHVDTGWLRQQGIAFASAAGCNANAVSEYVLTALACVTAMKGLSLPQLELGIVGAGNIGRRVARWARALGLRVLLNDPPLQRHTGSAEYLPLEALLEADVVTLHVPLTRKGDDPTWHLFDARRLARLRDDVVLINTARGAVIDNQALGAWLAQRPQATAVLDVWEGEPAIDAGLLERVFLGTPHIAGYSLEGKVNATALLHRALAKFLGQEGSWRPELPVVPAATKTVAGDGTLAEVLHAATSQVYDLRRDDRALRELAALPPADRARRFEALRADYALRREFANYAVHLQPMAIDKAAALQAVGFRVDG